MKLLVTGASGVLGREVLLAARSVGLAVRGLSRRIDAGRSEAEEWARGDLATGQGVDEAVRGCDAIVHAASDPRRGASVDVDGTRLLMEAAARAAVRHVLYVSIVGVDRIPYPYYQRKLAAEQIVAGSAVPSSILRATQFHPFLDRMVAAAARVPFVIPVPAGFLVQPVEASEVAQRVIRCLGDGPRGRVADFGGPDVLSFRDAALQWRVARHVDKPVVAVPVPGKLAAASRAGKGTAPDGDRGAVSWLEWLTQTRDR